MLSLIDDLLLAQEGRTAINSAPVSLAQVVETGLATVETGTATLESDADATVFADRGRLRQLFENSIGDAVEHVGDAVTVTVGPPEDGFYVEDDGAKIPASDREAVFDAGFSTNDAGTGFGLSTLGQVADAHDRTVSVTEDDAGGVRFEVRDVVFAA